ncbi:hypothetical protein M758_4G221300 [Ceratodon purpureus]|nr:hypothetical protein M758_4G221300 [Ceratodon purpureus]
MPLPFLRRKAKRVSPTARVRALQRTPFQHVACVGLLMTIFWPWMLVELDTVADMRTSCRTQRLGLRMTQSRTLPAIATSKILFSTTATVDSVIPNRRVLQRTSSHPLDSTRTRGSTDNGRFSFLLLWPFRVREIGIAIRNDHGNAFSSVRCCRIYAAYIL